MLLSEADISVFPAEGTLAPYGKATLEFCFRPRTTLAAPQFKARAPSLAARPRIG
jgi:hypothetical protein